MASLLIVVPGRAGQYFQDFSSAAVGATSFGDGSQLFASPAGVASVQDSTYKELQLTANGTGSTRTAFLLPDLDAGNRVLAFSAKWNADVYGNFPNAADGFSFNFGALAALNLIDSSYLQESGYPTGLCFSVQTYAGNSPGFYLRVNGGVVASQAYVPGTQWGTNNPTRHFFEVDWNYTNGVSVQVDGQTIFANVWTPGFTPQAGNRFAWAARCGAISEEVRLDNIVVVTGGNLLPLTMTSPFFYDTNIITSPAGAFDGNTNTVWADYNPFRSPVGVVGATAPAGSVVGAYALMAPYAVNALSGPASAPAGWQLEGSNDGSSWVACGTGSGHFLLPWETRCWLATNSTGYANYRLNVNTANGTPGLGLAELRFYAFRPVDLQGWVSTAAQAKSRWNGVACSGDCSKLVAVASGSDGVYQSTNAGQSWQKTAAPDNYWYGITCSTNGQVIAGYGAGFVCVSTNGGATWQQTLNQFISGMALTASGNRMIAVGSAGGWISANYGATWTQSSLPNDAYFQSVASSADGVTLFAVALNGFIYRSVNSGGSWTTYGAVQQMNSVACSPDGLLVLVAAGLYNGHSAFMRSVDHGSSYGFVSFPDQAWNSVAIASGTYGIGSYHALAVSGDQTWTTGDSGASWTQIETPSGASSFSAGATSHDGRTSVVAGTPSIWITGSATPTPPAATTGASDNIDGHNARLSATINPGYMATAYWFEWGTATTYGNRTAAGGPVSGGSPVTVQLTATGLVALTTYHYRAVASNSLGVAYGTDSAFATLGGAPSVGATTWQLGLGQVSLSSTVNPNFIATSARFDYAPVPLPMTNSTPSVSLGDGGSGVVLAQQLQVVAGTTYHLHCVASNSSGTAYGAEVTFTALSTNDLFSLTLPTDTLVPTSANSPSAEMASNAVDNSAAAKYLNFDKTNAGFTVYPSVTNRPVRALSLISANDAPERNPSSFALYGSPDGNNFTLLASNAVPLFANDYAIQSFAINNTNCYLAYKVIFPTVVDPTSANSMQIAEVELLPYGEITATNDTVSLSLPAGATLAGGGGATNSLVDHMVGFDTNKLAVLTDSNNVVMVVTPAAGSSVVKGFELVGGDDDASYPEREPSTVKLEGSNDGTNFTQLASVTPASPTANMQIQRFALFGNSGSYRQYRFTFGVPQSGDTLQIGEARLFGAVPPFSLSVRVTGGKLVASWPDAPGFSLQSNTNLNPLTWSAVTNTPVLSNGVDTATLPMGTAGGFFRLKK